MNHSDKALKTLTDMATVPADWGLTEIKWEWRTVVREVYVLCPKCKGQGLTWSYKGKSYTNEQIGEVKGFTRYLPAMAIEQRGAKPITCVCPKLPHLIRKRSYLSPISNPELSRHYDEKHLNNMLEHYSSNGRGLVERLRRVWAQIGVAQWADGTAFDSRFDHHDCGLCAKRIPSRQIVPVTGKGANDVIHGMFVGTDCARKFFQIKNFKKDQFVLREKSK